MSVRSASGASRVREACAALWRSLGRNRGRRARKSKSGRTLLVQERIIRQSYSEFEAYCNRGLETVVYWYGQESNSPSADVVTKVAVPDAERQPTHYHVPMEEAAKMGSAMMKDSLVCLAQFHTHPGELTWHSEYDDQNSISTRDGFLSLVAPRYGCRRDPSLNKVSIHEAWDGRWYLLAGPARKQRIRVVKDTADLRVGE